MTNKIVTIDLLVYYFLARNFSFMTKSITVYMKKRHGYSIHDCERQRRQRQKLWAPKLWEPISWAPKSWKPTAIHL